MRLKEQHGVVQINIFSAREGTFEPLFMRKIKLLWLPWTIKLIACIDGLKGFLDAIVVVYSPTKIQLCIVHMVRNSMKFMVWKDYKEVVADLKLIYQANTEEQALAKLYKFAAKYSQISKSCWANGANLRTFFEYPTDI